MKIIIVLILIPVLSISFFEGRKAYWDYRVNKMCEADGGIKIYEKTNKPLTYFVSNGFLKIPFEHKSKVKNEYFLRLKNTKILEGKLSVGEHRTQLVQQSGGKVISEVVTYGRSGGDLIGFSHPSYYSCETDKNLLESMFEKISNK